MTAASVAPVTISAAGRLGRDPESRTTGSGKDMALASLAVDLPAGKDADPSTWWLSLMAFGRVAGELAKHRKGDRLAVMGHLQRGTYRPRGGGPERESWTVLVDSVIGPRSPRPSGGKRQSGAAETGGPVLDDRARQDPPPPSEPPPFDDGLGF